MTTPVCGFCIPHTANVIMLNSLPPVETIICIPGDTNFGLRCCYHHTTDAQRLCFEYCMEQQIFPVGMNLINYLDRCGLVVSQSSIESCPIMTCIVKVKRSNGDIEDDWVLQTSSTKPIHYDKQYDAIFICAAKLGTNIEKYVLLCDDFCEMNCVKYDLVLDAMHKDLEMFYGLKMNDTSNTR